MYKVINCEKPGCGSPMTLRVHLGVRKMVCTKHKCRALSREFLSTYFDHHGAPHSLSVAHMNACPCIHHTSTHMSLFTSFYSPNARSLSLSLLYTRAKQFLSSQVHCAPCCMCHTSSRTPTAGDYRGKSYRTQLELALCFAWGPARIR